MACRFHDVALLAAADTRKLAWEHGLHIWWCQATVCIITKNAQTQIQSPNTQIHKYKHTNTQVQTHNYTSTFIQVQISNIHTPKGVIM